jgi:hypothetical protein
MVPLKVYFTATMPKTATGKIQRRLVAKAMIENEKKYSEAKVSWDSSSGSLKGQKSQESEKRRPTVFVMFPKMIMGVFGKCFHPRK